MTMATRGYVKQIDDNYFWYDINDKPHNLQSMEDSYIDNCVKMVNRRLESHQKTKTEDILKQDENFIRDFQSLLCLVREQEFRKSVKETAVGGYLYG
jgi:hypothetical protein